MAELVSVGHTVINLDHVVVAEISGMKGAADEAAIPSVSLRMAWNLRTVTFHGDEAMFLRRILESIAIGKSMLGEEARR